MSSPIGVMAYSLTTAPSRTSLFPTEAGFDQTEVVIRERAAGTLHMHRNLLAHAPGYSHGDLNRHAGRPKGIGRDW
jgi:hypothetical protein